MNWCKRTNIFTLLVVVAWYMIPNCLPSFRCVCKYKLVYRNIIDKMKKCVIICHTLLLNYYNTGQWMTSLAGDLTSTQNYWYYSAGNWMIPDTSSAFYFLFLFILYFYFHSYFITYSYILLLAITNNFLQILIHVINTTVFKIGNFGTA